MFKSCLHALSVTLLVAAAAFSLPAQADVPDDEIAALIMLYVQTNGTNWTRNDRWAQGDPCEYEWYGITCNILNTHVIGIDLVSNKLSGTIPNLSALSRLEYLGLEFNQLSGSIPDLSALVNLEYLGLAWNSLTGSIPDLSTLAALELLFLSGNELVDSIPDLSALVNLQVLYLSHNRLSGPIPDLSGLTSLEYVWLSSNKLTGSIPALSALVNLKWINVSDNKLTGPPPAPPSPSSLEDGQSWLCPNLLDHVPSAVWNAATGQSPWYQYCPLDKIFQDRFEN